MHVLAYELNFLSSVRTNLSLVRTCVDVFKTLYFSAAIDSAMIKMNLQVALERRKSEQISTVAARLDDELSAANRRAEQAESLLKASADGVKEQQQQDAR